MGSQLLKKVIGEQREKIIELEEETKNLRRAGQAVSDLYSIECDKTKSLQAKIEAANKILENLAKETHPKNYVLAYQHLEHVLKIPRNDEQLKKYELCGYSNCFKPYFKHRGFMPCCEFHYKNPAKWGKDGHTFTGSVFRKACASLSEKGTTQK